MGQRFDKESLIAFKLNSGAYGADPAPTGSNAVLVGNLKPFEPKINMLTRELVKGYWGADEEIPGSSYGGQSFSVEFQSSGSMTAPTMPAWEPILQVCGFKAGVGTAGQRVEYTLETDLTLIKDAGLYSHDSGALDKLLGCRGDFGIDLLIGQRPVFNVDIMGLMGGKSAVSNPDPAVGFALYKKPLAVTDANSGAMTLGGAYAAGAITGGTEYVSGGLTFKLGNKVEFSDMLGTATISGQSIEIVDRLSNGTVSFELTAAQEVSFNTSLLAASVQSMGVVHGVTAGLKMLIFFDQVQLKNPKKTTVQGRRVMSYDYTVIPPSKTNPGIKIVCL